MATQTETTQAISALKTLFVEAGIPAADAAKMAISHFLKGALEAGVPMATALDAVFGAGTHAALRAA